MRKRKHISRRTQRLRRSCACAIAAALLAVPVLADTLGGISAGEPGSDLRAEPAAEAEVLSVVPDGAYLLVEELRDGWYKVVYNGRSGYVSADHAALARTEEDRDALSGATLGELVGAQTESLAKAADDTGAEARVSSRLLGAPGGGVGGFTTFAEAPADIGATVGEQLVQTATRYLGYPYTWAGSSPATGFDCSGFAGYVYRLYGYSLQRIASSIYYRDGESVSVEELRPGDLLFFGYDGAVDHVGIYAGGGMMIHASNYDTGVILSELEGHYMEKLIGAKRVIT